jgi:hypothetical protein
VSPLGDVACKTRRSIPESIKAVIGGERSSSATLHPASTRADSGVVQRSAPAQACALATHLDRASSVTEAFAALRSKGGRRSRAFGFSPHWIPQLPGSRAEGDAFCSRRHPRRGELPKESGPRHLVTRTQMSWQKLPVRRRRLIEALGYPVLAPSIPRANSAR